MIKEKTLYPIHYSDHLEQKVGEALSDAGISFIHESQDNILTKALDFYLPDNETYIEVKQYHTDRTNEQLKRDDNIIVLQGKKSVEFFCKSLRKNYE